MEPIRNKKAGFDYDIIEKYECGISLLGTEVKSVRAQHANLTGAYVSIVHGRLVLIGAHIPAWQEKNAPEFDPYRTRALLIHKKELVELAKAAQTKGLTIVPLALYNKGRRIKLEIAVARGKAQFNKKESIKKRDIDRELRRKEY
jgi:SsrA-binding protein